MFLALRHKLALFDNYVNPFNRRGALRLSRYHPNAYLLLTLLAAMGGYLYLFLFPALLLAMPVVLFFSIPAAGSAAQWFTVSVELMLMIIGAVVTYTIATLRFSPPSGLELDKRGCPRLFELLQELGEAYGHPRIDRVVLRDRFDVRVVKTPRHGFSFRTNHTLVIGLPLLLTLSPIDVHVLVARRVGQLAGKQSRFNSWLYYLRDMWVQYLNSCNDRQSWLSRPLYSFFQWYVPRYRSLSLGVARICELKADRYAMQVISDRDAARGITGQVMVNDYLERTFWPSVIDNARSAVKPVKLPHARMAELFQGGLPADELDAMLKRIAKRRSNPKSTLPSLSERLNNMGHRKPLLPKPLAVTAAQFYLGGACDRYIELVDKRSSQKVRSNVIKQAGANYS
jgi:hypothetical protein